jgi:hypothetical protein
MSAHNTRNNQKRGRQDSNEDLLYSQQQAVQRQRESIRKENSDFLAKIAGEERDETDAVNRAIESRLGTRSQDSEYVKLRVDTYENLMRHLEGDNQITQRSIPNNSNFSGSDRRQSNSSSNSQHLNLTQDLTSNDDDDRQEEHEFIRLARMEMKANALLLINDLKNHYGSADRFTEKKFPKAKKCEGNPQNDEFKEGFHVLKSFQDAAVNVYVLDFLKEKGEDGAKDFPVIKDLDTYIELELMAKSEAIIRFKTREKDLENSMKDVNRDIDQLLHRAQEHSNARNTSLSVSSSSEGNPHSEPNEEIESGRQDQRAAVGGAASSSNAHQQMREEREKIAALKANLSVLQRDKISYDKDYFNYVDKIKSDALEKYQRDTAALENLKNCFKLLRRFVEELIQLTTHVNFLTNICNGVHGVHGRTLNQIDLPLNRNDMKTVYANLKKQFGIENSLTSFNLMVGLSNFSHGLDDEVDLTKYLEGCITNSQRFKTMIYTQDMAAITPDQLISCGMIMALPNSMKADFLKEEARHQDRVSRENDYDPEKIKAAETKFSLPKRVDEYYNQVLTSTKVSDAHFRNDNPDSKKARISANFETNAAAILRHKNEKKLAKINAVVATSFKKNAEQSAEKSSLKGKCYTWAKNGECKNKTTTCPYSHLNEDKPGATEDAKVRVCKAWQKKGTCRFGDDCYNSKTHTPENVNTQQVQANVPANTASKKKKTAKKKSEMLPKMITASISKSSSKTEPSNDSDSSSDSDEIDCLIIADISNLEDAEIVAPIKKSKNRQLINIGWDSMASTNVVESLDLLEQPKTLTVPGKASGLGGTMLITHTGRSKTFQNRSMDYIKDGKVPNLLSIGKELQEQEDGTTGIAIFNHAGAVHFRSTPELERKINAIIEKVARDGNITGEAVIKNHVYVQQLKDKRPTQDRTVKYASA